MPSLHLEVRDDEIIVTQSGSNYRIVYRKAEDQPQLIAKGTPHGNYDFLSGLASRKRQGARVGVDCVGPLLSGCR